MTLLAEPDYGTPARPGPTEVRVQIDGTAVSVPDGTSVMRPSTTWAQTRRTPNVQWHGEDFLEIHPHDAQERGIQQGAAVAITSRVGQTVVRARITDRMPTGVVYTTFHYPGSGANIVTTENSDWATNCPEYKVTAVQVLPTSATPVSDQGLHDPVAVQQVSDPAALVRMANQNAAHVAHRPRDQAVAEIAAHLRSSWPSAMRADLVAYLDAGGLGLTPLAAAAVEGLRDATTRSSPA